VAARDFRMFFSAEAIRGTTELQNLKGMHKLRAG
jgi:hypothetical protein